MSVYELRAVFFEVPKIELTGDHEADYHTMGKRAEALAQLVLDARKALAETKAEALAEVKEAVQEAIDDWDAAPDSAWMVYDRIAARLDPNYRRLPGEEGGVMVKPNLTSMENVLAWAQGYGDKRVGTNVKTDHETATYLAECVHLRQAFEQQERWRAGEAYDGINHERDIEQLRAAIKADKPHE